MSTVPEQQTKKAKEGFILKPPKGMLDFTPREMEKRDWVMSTIEDVFKRHGIGKLETPVMERREILRAKASEETSKQIYDIVDRKDTESGGESLSLRFDLTVSLARHVAERNLRSFSRYQYGKVYRGENISIAKGRYREFVQFDFDIIGLEAGGFADIRTVQILVEIFNALSLTPSFSIFLNHRVILRAMMTASGVPSELQMTCCSTIDKLDKQPFEDVAEELEKKGINQSSIELLRGFIGNQAASPISPSSSPSSSTSSSSCSSSPSIAADRHKAFIPTIDQVEKAIFATTVYSSASEDSSSLLSPSAEEIKEAFATLRTVHSAITTLGLPPCLSFVPSLARGHDYYTGIIFEGAFRNESGDALGTAVGGGRYDSLLTILNPALKGVGAIGFGLGFERLVGLVTEEKMAEVGASRSVEVMIAPVGFDKVGVESAEVVVGMLRVEQVLSSGGIRAEMWHDVNCNPKQVIGQCDAKRIPILIQLGQNEIESGTVSVKKIEQKKPLKPGEKKGGAKDGEAKPKKVTQRVIKLEDPELFAQIKEWLAEAAVEARERMEEEREKREKERIEKEKKEAKLKEKERRRQQAKAAKAAGEENKEEKREKEKKEEEEEEKEEKGEPSKL